ncbi:MAG: hypothetical protein ACREYF_16090 [Gammaproteobacteria bacterium]
MVEAYFKPSLSLSFASGYRGTLFGTIAEITSLMEGDGDVYGLAVPGAAAEEVSPPTRSC